MAFTGRRDVNAIWEELKAKSAPKQTPEAPVAKFPQLGAESEGSSSQKTSAARPPGEGDAGASEMTDEGPKREEELQERVARHVEALREGEQRDRQRAAEAINGVAQCASAELLATKTAVECIWAPLAKALEDPSERVREVSASGLRAGARAAEGAAEALPYAVPAMRARLLRQEGANGPVERAEEVREALHSLAGDLVRAAGKASAGHAAEIVDVLEDAHLDAHPNVAIEASRTARQLARALGRRLQPVGRRLIRIHAPSLAHRRAKVRAEAVDAVREAAHCGGHDALLDLMGYRHPNIVPIKAFFEGDTRVNHFGRLASDPSPRVRERFAAALEEWATSLPERKEHESRFVAFILACLSDESEAVSSRAFAALQEMGRQLEELERPEQLRPRAQNDPGLSAVPSHLSALSSPPRLGARVIVQENLSGVLPGARAELRGWQSDSRNRAAKLLHVVLSLAEEAATQHVPSLVPSLAAACHHSSEDEPSVREVASRCFPPLATSVPAAQWLDALAPLLDAEDEEQRERGLWALSLLIPHATEKEGLLSIADNLLHWSWIAETGATTGGAKAVMAQCADALAERLHKVEPDGALEQAERLSRLALAIRISPPHGDDGGKERSAWSALSTASKVMGVESAEEVIARVAPAVASALFEKAREKQMAAHDAERIRDLFALRSALAISVSAEEVVGISEALSISPEGSEDSLMEALAVALPLCDQLPDLPLSGVECALVRSIDTGSGRKALEAAIRRECCEGKELSRALAQEREAVLFAARRPEGEKREGVANALSSLAGCSLGPGEGKDVLVEVLEELKDDGRDAVRSGALQGLDTLASP